jgi:hypothetical protein
VLALIHPLLFVLALAQAAPVPVPTTIPEIGRTHAKTFCERIEENTSATVVATLRNNQNIDSEIVALRRVSSRDFSNDLYRAQWDKTITRYATDMNGDIKSARTKLDELRDLATKTPDTAFRDEINAYVDALDKAQGEQSKIARLTLIMLVVDQGRTATIIDDGPSPFGSMSRAPAAQAVPQTYANNDRDDAGASGNKRVSKFQEISRGFASMVPGIVAAENQAALHARPLLAACGKPDVSPDPSL